MVRKLKIIPKILKETGDISRGYKNRKESLVEFLKSGLLLIVFLGILMLVISGIGTLLPDSFEKLLTYSSYFSPKNLTSNQSRVFDRAKIVLEKHLREGVHRSLPYSLGVLESTQINAFAAPGGYVILTTGLLDLEPSSEALSFVIGHELGHHELRHVSRRFSLVVILGLLTNIAAGHGQLDQILNFGVNGLMRPYGRGDEREADNYATKRCLAIDGHLRGAEEFFRVLVEAHEKSGFTVDGGFFSTHPTTSERIRNIKKNK